jgi:toxin CcdB
MIRQFDVVLNPVAALRASRPYLLCVQHRILDHATTRLMAALTTERVDQSLPRLHPRFEIAHRMLYLLPQDLLTLPLRVLKNPVANLSSESSRITAALDLVFTGV